MSVLINADTSDGLKFTSDTSGEIKLQSAGADKITMTSDGNLGIGTTTPSYTAAGRTIWTLNGSTDSVWTMNYGGTVGMYAQASATDGKLYTTGSLPLLFGTGSTERMRIDPYGNVQIGATSNIIASLSNKLVIDSVGGNTEGLGIYRASTGASGHIGFFNPNGRVGEIYTNGTATVYNTSSDYRLKENVLPMSGSIDRLKQLKPSTWSWTTDGSYGEGFLAHEAQEVVPEAISGTKDEVDDEGNPVYQGIDQSKLVPLLTAALQEAITKIEDLETRIQELENA